MSPHVLQHVKPRSLEEACAILDGEDAAVIAGGTELFPRMKNGLTRPRYLVDLSELPGLTEISSGADGSLRLGAGVSLTDIERSPLVANELPALAQVARRVGAPALRNMGSLGGNLCQETMCWWYNQAALWRESKGPCYKADGEMCYVVNQPRVCYAVYRSDVATMLMGLEAELAIQGTKGGRRMPITELYSGDPVSPFTLARDELITAVLVRPLEGLGFATFQKHAHRKAIDYPLISIALVAHAGEAKGNGGRGVSRLRMVLGAVDGMPLRVERAEELVLREGLDDATIEAAAKLASKCAKPVRNVSFGAPGYRRRMAAVLSRRALRELREWIERPR